LNENDKKLFSVNNFLGDLEQKGAFFVRLFLELLELYDIIWVI